MHTIGWLVIILIYTVIGILAAVGFIGIAHKLFKGKQERIFYAVFMVMIALFYLAFVMYFSEPGSVWNTELLAISIFTILAIVGAVNTEILILAYVMHGVWDFLHEWQQQYGALIAQIDQLTQVPLAYGVFCLAFDFVMAGYFFYKRHDWR